MDGYRPNHPCPLTFRHAAHPNGPFYEGIKFKTESNNVNRA